MRISRLFKKSPLPLKGREGEGEGVEQSIDLTHPHLGPLPPGEGVIRFFQQTVSRCVRSLLLVGLACAGAGAVSAADNEIRVLPLKHRTAPEVIPLLRPLLAPGDALTGTDYRLIVRTSDKNLKEIERVLAQIDAARRTLRITVRQTLADEHATERHELSGTARVGKARVTVPENPAAGDEGLTAGSEADGLRYRTRRTETAARGDNTHSVAVLDGQRAFVRLGQAVPYVRVTPGASGRGAPATVVEERNVTAGVDVLPRVRGERVMLEITPRLSRLEDLKTGTMSVQELTTTVTARLGEWIDLGEILGADNQAGRAILESAGSESGERRMILLKVEENK